jgi:hypothetical protein
MSSRPGRQHLLQDAGADAGPARHLRRDLAAPVLAAEDVTQDAIAILDGIGGRESGRIVDVALVVAPLAMLRATTRGRRAPATFCFTPPINCGRSSETAACALVFVETELLRELADHRATARTHDGFNRLHEKKC